MILAITNADAKYVAAAYGIVFLVMLLYVLIITLKLARLEREASELTEQLRARRVPEPDRERVPVG